MSSLLLRLLLAVGLGFFLGLAFEEFHARGNQKRPGGIRSFPLLALIGALLYQLDPSHLVLLSVGLFALSAWLTGYYITHFSETDPDGQPNVGLMVPVCNVLAFLLGPVALAQPSWIAVGTTVAGVLLLTAREDLHEFARKVELHEIVNAGRFLLLTGFVLPLLPDTPFTSLTDITPRQIWLALLAVCSVSYASYLLQRYIAPTQAGLLTAVLGGLYSSTATTVVLARRARTAPAAGRQAETGIILATAIMYLRILTLVGILNWPLAIRLAPELLGLAILGAGMAVVTSVTATERNTQPMAGNAPTNPLDVRAGAVFAALFIVTSIASTWAIRRFGTSGIYILAAVVGVADADPFALNIAQHGAGSISAADAVIAIILASSSNNVAKAAYAVAYSGGRLSLWAPGGLAFLAGCGAAAALLV